MLRRIAIALALLAALSPGLASGEDQAALREIENHMSIAERVAIQMALKDAGMSAGEIDEIAHPRAPAVSGAALTGSGS